MRKMSEQHLVSYAVSGSSQGSSCRERRFKRNEDRRREQGREHFGPGEGLS